MAQPRGRGFVMLVKQCLAKGAQSCQTVSIICPKVMGHNFLFLFRNYLKITSLTWV